MRIFIVMTMLSGDPTPHAIGPFATEAKCLRWAQLLNLSMTEEWLSICMPESMARLVPGVVFDRDS